MSDLADLFPGFSSHWIGTQAGKIFARKGGSGTPLLLLHGFPETSAMWHGLAPALAQDFTVVLMDLRGYGWSAVPESQNGAGYSKRVMGEDAVAVMDHFGFARFALAGHDRGARVGYRLALDQPGRISKLALLDIIPTEEVWKRREAGSSTSPHWPILAEPAPAPEQAFGAEPDASLGGLMAKWTKANSLDAFDLRAMAHYRAGWNEPSRIHAMCEDYRAGATIDRQDDQADMAAGRKLTCPTTILASTAFLNASGEKALQTWHRTFAPDATGTEIDSGHFMAEENTPATLGALRGFLLDRT